MAFSGKRPEAADGRQAPSETSPQADGPSRIGAGVMRPAVVICAALALFASLLAGQERVAPKKLKPDQSCLSADCHANKAKGAVVHKPITKKQCIACHDQEDEELHEFTLIDEGSELCYGCHKSVTKSKTFIHKPVQDKKKPCLACHNPHSTASKGLVKAESITGQCLTCHKEMAKGARYHKAGTVDSRTITGCSSCHDPHGSNSRRFLRAAPQDLCLNCHTEMKESLTGAKYAHGPLAEGCIGCHEPHRPLTGKGLKKRGAGLCMTCHEHFTPTVTAMSKNHSKLLDGNDCGRCHSPHFSSRKFLLTSAPSKLCLECHTTGIKTKSGRKIPGVEAQPAKEMHLHGPLAQEECGKCHEPHGNERFSFLRKSYPGTFYSPYKLETYALCFGCHKSSLVADSRTLIATNFRNGSVNLHYLHVNKPFKGRTCRACHANHATPRPHMLTETVPFGPREIPLGYTGTANGGTCATGCHRSKSYDREKPVKLYWVDQGAIIQPPTQPTSQPATQPAGAKGTGEKTPPDKSGPSKDVKTPSTAPAVPAAPRAKVAESPSPVDAD